MLKLVPPALPSLRRDRLPQRSIKMAEPAADAARMTWFELGGDWRSTVLASPLDVSKASATPSRLLSMTSVQPHCHSLSLATHDSFEGVRTKLRPPPRRTLSVRANISVDSSSAAAWLACQRWMSGVKLGSAMLIRTASIEMVISSSMRVRPCCL